MVDLPYHTPYHNKKVVQKLQEINYILCFLAYQDYVHGCPGFWKCNLAMQSLGTH